MTDPRGTRRGLTRRELLAAALAGGSAALLAGCQPAASPAAPAAAPTAAAPAAAPPQQAAATAAPAAWEQQWNDLIAAARQEGRIVLVGPPDPNLRTALPKTSTSCKSSASSSARSS